MEQYYNMKVTRSGGPLWGSQGKAWGARGGVWIPRIITAKGKGAR